MYVNYAHAGLSVLAAHDSGPGFVATSMIVKYFGTIFEPARAPTILSEGWSATESVLPHRLELVRFFCSSNVRCFGRCLLIVHFRQLNFQSNFTFPPSIPL